MFGGDIALLANERCVQIGGKQVGIDKRNNLVKICHFFLGVASINSLLFIKRAFIIADRS